MLTCVGDRPLLGPHPLHQRDRFVHDRVALVVAVEDAVGGQLVIPAAGDQVDGDAAAGELVEGADQLRRQRRLQVARPCRDEHR